MEGISVSSADCYSEPGRNHLLDLLPADDYARLTALLKPRQLRLSEVLVQRDRPISNVFFPTTAIASVLTQMDTGESVETGTIGNDGFVGIPLLLGASSSPNEVICQVEGDALVMRAADFQSVLAEMPAMRSVFNRFAQAYLIMGSQATACNRLHKIDQRCAKWLLMTHDRVGTDTFQMTQEFLALMLGVRRPSVSVAAEVLQAAGVVSYHRGAITVLDRAGLEAATCECYRVTRDEYDRLLRPEHEVTTTGPLPASR